MRGELEMPDAPMRRSMIYTWLRYQYAIGLQLNKSRTLDVQSHMATTETGRPGLKCEDRIDLRHVEPHRIYLQANIL